MLLIRVNKEAKSEEHKEINIEIKQDVLFFNMLTTDSNGARQHFEASQKLSSYFYYLVFCRDGQMHILNYNKINNAARFSFKQAATSLLISDRTAFITTGMIVPSQPQNTDIVIDIFNGCKENIKIKADQKCEIKDFDFTEANPQSRAPFFDSYSLIINGKEYKAGSKGNFIDCSFDEAIPLQKQYVITLQKYKRKFEFPLNREIDDDEVTIESTAGIINTRRVYLDKGRGSFLFFPFEYTGKFKIKLGRRWMENWNEYNFTLTNKS
ncbi:MAG: hypothetical protein LBH29_03380 [Elusimicrobiota bacterium]|jgi:hypothetical protein|nr:hypothetical protein [Elusimicrobiota bacterium]